jgi:hypothetical protein
MAITQAMCTSFKEALLNKEMDLGSGGDTIKIALYTSSATLGASTTAYSTTNEITNTSGTAYTAGGLALTTQVVDTDGTTAYFDADDPEWTSASFTTAGALIYNDTVYQADNTKGAIAVLNFGGDFTVTSGTFRIVFPDPGSTAIVRID